MSLVQTERKPPATKDCNILMASEICGSEDIKADGHFEEHGVIVSVPLQTKKTNQ